jgi:hypothetical protein
MNWWEQQEQEAKDRKAKREREDLQYERDRAQEDLECSERSARRDRDCARARHQELDSELTEVKSFLDDAIEEKNLAHQWIREQGLWEQFDEWASFRRPS